MPHNDDLEKLRKILQIGQELKNNPVICDAAYENLMKNKKMPPLDLKKLAQEPEINARQDDFLNASENLQYQTTQSTLVKSKLLEKLPQVEINARQDDFLKAAENLQYQTIKSILVNSKPFEISLAKKVKALRLVIDNEKQGKALELTFATIINTLPEKELKLVYDELKSKIETHESLQTLIDKKYSSFGLESPKISGKDSPLASSISSSINPMELSVSSPDKNFHLGNPIEISNVARKLRAQCSKCTECSNSTPSHNSLPSKASSLTRGQSLPG